MSQNELEGDLDAFLIAHESDLISFRRDLHSNPETAYTEYRTTRLIMERLQAVGLRPTVLPKGTGVIVDIGECAEDDSIVALRADIDALPISDEKHVPYKSLRANVCHACGHDVHTTILLGAAMVLAGLAEAGQLPGKVRLIFQPAEELTGGALDVMAAGGLSSVGMIFALHCDPKLDVGQIGTKIGPITAACDKVTVKLFGPGGHTARPHLTADLVYALAKIITDVPAALSRRIDPRSGVSLVWGQVGAGSSANAIPITGQVEGTVRCLGDDAWHAAPDLLKELVESVATTYGVTTELVYQRNAPPTVNDPIATGILETAAKRMLGQSMVQHTRQSMGGEDFAWYLESVPGTLARLGTRNPSWTDDFDIHQSTFDVDEKAIGIGIRVMVATALDALGVAAPRTVSHHQDRQDDLAYSACEPIEPDDIVGAVPLLTRGKNERPLGHGGR